MIPFLTKNVVTAFPEATIQEVAQQMRDFHVGDVVIVKIEDEVTVPIGILTDRDIVLSTVAFGISPEEVLARDVMTPTLATAKITDSFYHILNLMKENGVRRVPLVTPAGHLTGIVSSEDIVEILATELSDLVKIKEKQHEVELDRRRQVA